MEPILLIYLQMIFEMSLLHNCHTGKLNHTVDYNFSGSVHNFANATGISPNYQQEPMGPFISGFKILRGSKYRG